MAFFQFFVLAPRPLKGGNYGIFGVPPPLKSFLSSPSEKGGIMAFFQFFVLAPRPLKGGNYGIFNVFVLAL